MEGMRRAGVPARYMDAEPVPLPEDWAYVTGVAGSGKTHLVCGMLRTWCEMHLGCYDVANINGDVVDRYYSPAKAKFVTAAGYLDGVKAGFADSSRPNLYRTTPLLVIDDLGQEVPTQWAVAQLFELINYRYGERLKTIVTSQFGLGQLARKLARNGGEEQAIAIASRLREVCKPRDLGNVDRRLLA